jgi:hypothetical protein
MPSPTVESVSIQPVQQFEVKGALGNMVISSTLAALHHSHIQPSNSFPKYNSKVLTLKFYAKCCRWLIVQGKGIKSVVALHGIFH